MAAENPEKAADKLLNVIRGRFPGDNNKLILGAIQSFMISAEAVSQLWDHTGTNMIEGYPKCLPSWDEFVHQVQQWYAAQLTERGAKPNVKR